MRNGKKLRMNIYTVILNGIVICNCSFTCFNSDYFEHFVCVSDMTASTCLQKDLVKWSLSWSLARFRNTQYTVVQLSNQCTTKLHILSILVQAMFSFNNFFCSYMYFINKILSMHLFVLVIYFSCISRIQVVPYSAVEDLNLIDIYTFITD